MGVMQASCYKKLVHYIPQRDSSEPIHRDLPLYHLNDAALLRTLLDLQQAEWEKDEDYLSDCEGLLT